MASRLRSLFNTGTKYIRTTRMPIPPTPLCRPSTSTVYELWPGMAEGRKLLSPMEANGELRIVGNNDGRLSGNVSYNMEI